MYTLKHTGTTNICRLLLLGALIFIPIRMQISIQIGMHLLNSHVHLQTGSTLLFNLNILISKLTVIQHTVSPFKQKVYLGDILMMK